MTKSLNFIILSGLQPEKFTCLIYIILLDFAIKFKTPEFACPEFIEGSLLS